MSTHRSAAMVRAAFKRAAFYNRDVRCEYCHHAIYQNVSVAHRRRATGDHRTPLARGGQDTRTNIAIVCYYCNARKGPLTEQEFMTLRDDPERLARVVVEWHARLNQTPVYGSRKARKVAKYERRMARLTERLRIPDASCEHCGGAGKIRDNSRLERYCRCTLEPLSAEAAADYVDGRAS